MFLSALNSNSNKAWEFASHFSLFNRHELSACCVPEPVLRTVGIKDDRDQAPCPTTSHSGTLGPGQDERPGMELNVTGSQAGQSR